jgi:hypothetical protein
MMNHASMHAVAAARHNENFAVPLYDTYCFSQVPQTVIHALTGEGTPGLPSGVWGDLPTRYNKVILCFIDAFGWRFFEQYAERYPFLRRFGDQGVVSKLTTQFPSTTSAHTTTIHSGLPVGQSGIYEWFLYDPSVDRIIVPLLYSYAGDRERNTLRKAGLPPETYFPATSIYQQLRERRVDSAILQSREFTPSPFSDVVCKGAHLAPFKTISEGLVNLTTAVKQAKGKGYYYLYFDGIDSICHLYGPNSPQFEAEIDTFFTAMERYLFTPLAGQVSDTALLLIADHGQIEVSTERMLNLRTAAPALTKLIRTNRAGELLVPAGSPRDLFLHIKEEHLDEAAEIAQEAVAGRADVYRTQDLIAQGLFGTVSEALLRRVGNLVVLPRKYEQAWWFESTPPTYGFRGHHGGLAAAEMETIFLALAL